MKRNSIFYKKYLLNLIKKYLNTKKRILNKIKKFNHKDNILKNIKIYELTPTNQINDYTYLEYLEAAINKKNITNIALSGPYGSGKSSILKAFENMKNKNSIYEIVKEKVMFKTKSKVLNISLATFKDDDGKVLTQEEYKSIEKSILQQMLYSVEPSEIANSRFKRIKANKYLVLKTISFFVWIISLIELFSPFTLIYHFYNNYDFTYIFATIFLIGSLFILKVLLDKLPNIQISKFIIQDQEISFSGESQKSILNEHIDEIIYFFDKTKYNIVIIEDLDRFDNIEIFIKLREINIILNKKKNKRKVSFIYAIKDDIFTDKDRTKFFDYIIPVVPFINSSNSFKKLTDLLEQENLLNKKHTKDFKKINARFIKDISIYINDMRFLTNVFNEFIQYTNKLSKEIDLDYNHLFAMALYKNYKPNDFAKLHNNEGIIYSIFSNDYKNDILSNITFELESKIQELTEKIESINSNTVSSIEELNSIYLYYLMDHLKEDITHLYINHKEYTIYQIIKNHFNLLTEEKDSITYKTLNSYTYNRTISFKNLENLVDKNYQYEYKKNSIVLKQNNEIESLKLNREKSIKELNKIRSSSISNLLYKNNIPQDMVLNNKILNKYLKNQQLTDITEDHLLLYLLRYGYINENYFKYISYYHAGQETPNDINFILNIQRNGQALDYNLELSSFDYILDELSNNIFYFSNPSILNYSLIYYLLNENKTVSSKIKNIFESIETFMLFISSDLSKYFEFVENYINKYNDNSILKYLMYKNDLLWDFIYLNSQLSKDKKDLIFYKILNLNYESYQDKFNILNKIDLNGNLESYIKSTTNFNKFTNNIIDMKFFKYFLIKKQIKFKQINDFYYENENFNFIYENNLYEINFEWINKILYHVPISHLMEKNYTSIINSNRNHLISNINSNINKYVECILLQCEIIKDYEIDIIYLLNSNILENILKYEIVNKMTTIISDINKVNNFSWEYLLEKQKIEPSANNIKACIENKDLDNIIIQRYINNLTIYTKIFNSKCKYTNEDIDNFRFEDIMFDSENINPNVFEAFLTSIDTIYSDFFEDQSKDFLSIIIKMKKVETNINTYIYLINQNYISLAIKLLENNPYILIENFALFNLSSEILMNLIKSNNLNNNQKISLLNFSNTNNISGYQDIIEILYNLKIENFKLLKNEFFDILLCSILEENKKIELFLQYNFKSREEVTKYLLNINHNFESLTKLSTKKLKIKKTEFLLKLISKLNNINYISSFKEHKYDIEINTFRTNKDIFI